MTRFRLLFLAALFAALPQLRSASEPLRLDEIAISRFVRTSSGEAWLKQGLLDSLGGFRETAASPVLSSVSVPPTALDRNLISLEAWIAYSRLGPEAVVNYVASPEDTQHRVGDRYYIEVTVNPDPHLSHGKLVNLSSRGFVTPARSLVGGFVIDRQHRSVLIRAVGPSLASFGVPSAHPNPYLTIYHGNTGLYFNDNWSERPDAAAIRAAAEKVGAFPLPAGSRDAVLLVELAPGSYTAHAISPSGEEGEVLLEIYSVPE